MQGTAPVGEIAATERVKGTGGKSTVDLCCCLRVFIYAERGEDDMSAAYSVFLFVLQLTIDKGLQYVFGFFNFFTQNRLYGIIIHIIQNLVWHKTLVMTYQIQQVLHSGRVVLSD